MQHDRKVYDSDLKLTPLLKEIAHTYAREYVGNFDMMIEARAYLVQHGQLPEGQYRPVLNTLRTDIMRPDLWAAVCALRSPASGPYEAPVATATGLAEVVVMDERRPPGGGRYAHESDRHPHRPEPRFKLVVKGRCKVPFATSIHMAKMPVVHLFRRNMSVEWWRHRFDNRELDYSRPLEVFKPDPRFVCSRHFHLDRIVPWMKHPSYDEAFPGRWINGEALMPFCRACVKSVLDLSVNDDAVHQGEVW